MSFLDKINAAKNSTAAAEKKVNPLLKKAAPEVPAVAAVPAPTPAPALVTKPNPLLKAATPAVLAAAQDAPAAPKKTLTLPFKKKADETPAVAPTPAPALEVQSEVKIVANPIVAEAPAEAPPVETPAAEKKTAARRTSGSRAKKEPTSEEGQATDAGTVTDEPMNLPTTSMNFATAAAALTSPFTDSEWEEFKEGIEVQLNEIVITQEMNPGTLKVTLTELNMVYDQIAQPLHQTRSLLDNLTNKEDGTIVVIKSVNTGTGNNDMERKKAGYLAAMNYAPKNGGGNINLFEMAAEVRSRYYFLKNIFDRIQYKANMLITMNGALKLEKDFIQRGEVA
jgi:hypothetical protein